MATPEKPKTPSKVAPRTPQKKSSPMPLIRSPGFIAPSPNETVPYTYAAGVLPMSYTMSEDGKDRIWQILLCIEFRRNENRLCLHPLAGKKEIIDEDIPLKTALREFTEESYGVFKDFNLQAEITLNVCTSATWTFIKQSAMYFLFTYIPYNENIQQLYLQAKGENPQGSALVWIPFDDFLKSPHKISARFDGKTIEPSDCFRSWLKMDEMKAGYNKIVDLTLERLERNKSPIGHAETPQDVDIPSDELASLNLNIEKEPKLKKEDEPPVKPQDS